MALSRRLLQFRPAVGDDLLVGRDHRLSRQQQFLQIPEGGLHATQELGDKGDAGVIEDVVQAGGEHVLRHAHRPGLAEIAHQRLHHVKPYALPVGDALAVHPQRGEHAAADVAQAQKGHFHYSFTHIAFRFLS